MNCMKICQIDLQKNNKAQTKSFSKHFFVYNQSLEKINKLILNQTVPIGHCD